MPVIPLEIPLDGSAEALLQSFAMIIVSEIGDKTFLIAAILAMRHPRTVVFAGALGSLIVMSILSAAMGHILPTLIPRRWTQIAAAILFLVFGSKMMLEARQMSGGREEMEEGMKEAQEDIEGDEAGVDGELEAGAGGVGAVGGVIPMKRMEEGHAEQLESSSVSPPLPPPPSVSSSSKTTTTTTTATFAEGLRNFCSLFLGPVFVQAFILTFLGEWGDRSQIATIALGAAHNVYIVALGTIIGHSCCTALAVIGGRYVSTKISVKHVTLGGSILFLLFGVIYLYEAFAMASDIEMSIPLNQDEPPPSGLL